MRLRARADVKMEVTCPMTLTRSTSESVCEREWEDLGFEQTESEQRICSDTFEARLQAIL